MTATLIDSIGIRQCDSFALLDSLTPGCLDLLLTDPPYGISADSNFHTMKGRRTPIKTDFGDWDKTKPDLFGLATRAYLALRDGGTAIVWYDWRDISALHNALAGAGFRMLRLVVWSKPAPLPTNASATYLSTPREYAVVGVKGSRPTFNSRYDRGDYTDNVPRGKSRLHPTQKPLSLFAALMRKHSDAGMLVCDPYLGNGTTAEAAVRANRRFIGCDLNATYVELARKRVEAAASQLQLV